MEGADPKQPPPSLREDEIPHKDPAARAAYMRAYYRRNSDRWNEYRRGFHQDRRERLAQIKLESGCVKCGYRASACALHFHHRDPATKCFSISGTARIAWKKVKAEIEKCDVLCANCHSSEHCDL